MWCRGSGDVISERTRREEERERERERETDRQRKTETIIETQRQDPCIRW